MNFIKKLGYHYDFKVCLRAVLEVVAVVLFYSIGCILSQSNNFMAFFWMFIACIVSFLYYAILSKNLLDLRAILYGSITGAVALCQLRLSQIQVVWETKTWVLLATALCFFSLGYSFVAMFKPNSPNCEKEVESKKIFFKKFTFKFNPKKVYYTTIFLAVMPIILFCIQVAIKGFIPIFVQRYDAYMLFYTRLSIFINLVMFSAPLAFWCLKNMDLKRGQRILMYAIIPLPTIIFQLMVQRGLFVWSICILLVVVYLQSKRKFLGVTLVVGLLIFGIVFSSAMRAIPAEAMREIWQMDDTIVLSPDSDSQEEDDDTDNEEGKPQKNPSITIKIPDFAYAPYYYIVSGMENFNHMVTNLEDNAWGLRQLTPFTVILRFPALKELIAEYPDFRILPNSTNCLISDFYYDFGIVGVIVEMFLLGILSAIVQFFAKQKNNLFAILEYGVLLSVLLTAFFAAWISVFGTWLFAGTAFLVFLYTYFSLVKNKRDKKEEIDG